MMGVAVGGARGAAAPKHLAYRQIFRTPIVQVDFGMRGKRSLSASLV